MTIKEKYNKTVVPEMKKKFGIKNNFDVPRIEKVVVNTGIGKYLKDSNQTTEVINAITVITGQKPVLTKSKKSIAGFKIREGLEVGVKVTLRGKRMWDFVDRLVGAALPRVRDFHGIKGSSVDKSGNLNIGIREHLIFPEILPEQVKTICSFQVVITTNVNDHDQGEALFRLLGFPLEHKE